MRTRPTILMWLAVVLLLAIAIPVPGCDPYLGTCSGVDEDWTGMLR